MSERNYQDYPDHILIKTDTGVVELAITEYNHIYVNGQECRPCGRSLSQTVRGREVMATLHLNNYGKGFEPARDQDNPRSSYHSFYSSKATDAQRKVIVASWVKAVNEYVANFPMIQRDAEQAHGNNRAMRIEEEITELEQKIAAKRAELAAVTSPRSELIPSSPNNIVLFSCCGAYGKVNPKHVCDGPRVEEDNS